MPQSTQMEKERAVSAVRMAREKPFERSDRETKRHGSYLELFWWMKSIINEFIMTMNP